MQAKIAAKEAEITQISPANGESSNKKAPTEVPSKPKKQKTDDEPLLKGATNTTRDPALTESTTARELEIKFITEQVTRSLQAQMAKDLAEQTKKIQEEAANKAKETAKSKSPAYYQGRQTRPAFYNQRQRRQPFHRSNSRSRSRSRYNRRSRSRDVVTTEAAAAATAATAGAMMTTRIPIVHGKETASTKARPNRP